MFKDFSYQWIGWLKTNLLQKAVTQSLPSNYHQNPSVDRLDFNSNSPSLMALSDTGRRCLSFPLG